MRAPTEGRATVPAWVRWAMRALLTPTQLHEALDELDDLHAHWVERYGAAEAARRYRREARRYPLQLLLGRLRSMRPPDFPHLLAAGARRVRSLTRAPALSSSIVLTLGVGIGGCTALFAVADVLFLRPLPYPDGERLMWIYTENPPYRFNFSVADFEALEAEQRSFDRVASLEPVSRTFIAGDQVERLSVWEVTPGFFEVLGITPLAGVGSSRVDLQACKLEYSIVSPK